MKTKELKNELARCLKCKLKPCEKACPLGVSPRDFIEAATLNDFTKAAALIAAKNPLPATCGFVCPDRFCQKSCIRAKIDKALQIPCLQAEIMRRGGYPELQIPEKNFKKAAIIGGGIAGLAATYELLINGWQIDLYEKENCLGGAAKMIPQYRLPRSILDFEINRIVKNNRVNVKFNTNITDFQSLKKEYDGVILALGETVYRKLNIPGENHCISYSDYLCHPEKYKSAKIAVTGGGEVALDCALTAKKNGCECVEMFVRRRREDMRITASDQLELEHFGIIVRDLSSITKITAQKETYTLSVTKNIINDKGLATPLFNSEYSLSGYNILIQALGAYYPKEQIPEGFIIAGDMTGSCGTIVQALASGKNAAHRLIEEQ